MRLRRGGSASPLAPNRRLWLRRGRRSGSAPPVAAIRRVRLRRHRRPHPPGYACSAPPVAARRSSAPLTGRLRRFFFNCGGAPTAQESSGRLRRFRSSSCHVPHPPSAPASLRLRRYVAAAPPLSEANSKHRTQCLVLIRRFQTMRQSDSVAPPPEYVASPAQYSAWLVVVAGQLRRQCRRPCPRRRQLRRS